MADEHTPYLDPDYTPDPGDLVEIYVNEGAGTVFSLILGRGDFLFEAGDTFELTGLNDLDQSYRLGHFQLNWDHLPFEHTVTVET